MSFAEDKQTLFDCYTEYLNAVETKKYGIDETETMMTNYIDKYYQFMQKYEHMNLREFGNKDALGIYSDDDAELLFCDMFESKPKCYNKGKGGGGLTQLLAYGSQDMHIVK